MVEQRINRKHIVVIILVALIASGVLLLGYSALRNVPKEQPDSKAQESRSISCGDVTEEQKDLIIMGLKLYYMFNCPQGFIDHNCPKIPGEQGEGWYAVIPDFGYTSVAQLQEDFDRCISLDWSLNRDLQYTEENGVIYGYDPAKGHEVVLFDEPFEFRLVSSADDKYEVEVVYYSYGEGGYYKSTDLITVENNIITGITIVESILIKSTIE